MTWIRERVAALVAFFSTTNERTWKGHGLQAVAFSVTGAIFGLWLIPGQPVAYFSGWIFSEGAFFHRELDNFVVPALDPEIGVRKSWEKVREDGLMDFLVPHVAGGASSLVTVLLWELLA